MNSNPFANSDRRAVLAGVVAASVQLCGRAQAAAPDAALDDRIRTWLRFVCDLSGRTTYAVTSGQVWGFAPQADGLTTDAFAKRLYGYWSLVARKADVQAAGPVAVRTKGWTFYLDSETGAPITQLINPYTGKTVPCPPLSPPPSTTVYPAAPAAGAAGAGEGLDLRERRLGRRAWVDVARISRFKPADTTWFKLEADLVSYSCLARDLDRQAAFTPSTWSHNLVAEWQTWMGMHGTPGHILFKGDGVVLDRPGDVPAVFAAAMDARFPGALAEVMAWR